MLVNAPIKSGELRANMDFDQYQNEYMPYSTVLPKERCEVCRLRDKDLPIKDDMVKCFWENKMMDYRSVCGYFKNWTMRGSEIVMDPAPKDSK